MSHRVFFLTKLHACVDPADYARWVREAAYPFARRMPSIRSYVVTRLDSMLEGEGKPPYDFVEVVEVTDLDTYKAELDPENPEVQAFDEEWLSYVDEAVAVVGEMIE